ncbi:unnamed protein product, partial [Mesorhabditis spiculigera]
MPRSICKKRSWKRVREEWSRQDAGVFIRRTLDKGIEGLREEFNRNPRIYDTAKCTVSCRNPELNRYKDICCHDHNRVHVVGANPDEYIHANYVGTEYNPKRFICTQGPMETTCADFWMMVIQQNVEIKYTSTSSPDAVVDIRTLKVNGLNSEIVVKHYHWRFWPDRGAPPPFPLVIRMLEKQYSKQNPIVVHCSAGVGRIGPLVLMQGILELIKRGKDFKVEDLLKEMRQSRAGLVQTVHQYYYVHAVLLEYFAKQKPYQCPLGNRQADFDKFMADYTKAVAQVDNNKSTMSYLPSSDLKTAT